MERPYLKDGKRGNTRNFYDEVKDYSENKPSLDVDKFNNIMEDY